MLNLKETRTVDATREYNNPLVEQRADPWVYKHNDGYYYFTASVPEYDRIEVRRSSTLEGLRDTQPVVAWRKYETGMLSANIWAPEIHFIQGKWYIYFAAARTTETKEGLFDHRMYVLENTSANPLEGEWVEKGQVRTAWESFALDATTFEHQGRLYYVWAQKDPEIEGNSNLYISAMSNPWTLSGEQVMISTPEHPWEVIGFKVNEGAAFLKRNGRIFISYSASATDHNYCMGLLSADESSDLLDPQSWTKSPEPVFQTNEETGQYGPGHNSFTVSEDGQDVLIYHARNYKEITGDPLYDPNRHTRAQVFGWNENGTPNFGIPVRDGIRQGK
ncbi:alpha-N-arabinofuranosidase [Paenibacillus zeisoli]|uniref:Alpha-N-arabinofuranosidase n=1 Tax=Paenibacillus zeisoli TaxID=2496267 RepID=A0A3S1CY49_9BACL|nr:family 43 glycosylhydrolase [Paenibacillus zeisoli]RUT29862.1 alpha-N-arabinofuranosidase [Paenibacillus zeisoli]